MSLQKFHAKALSTEITLELILLYLGKVYLDQDLFLTNHIGNGGPPSSVTKAWIYARGLQGPYQQLL